jgi:hypothetical protein
MNSIVSPFVVVDNHVSVMAAAEFSGYSLQYLRRLLRCSRLAGLKIGQVWLIEKSAFESYLEKAVLAKDRRFGPKSFFYQLMFTIVNTSRNFDPDTRVDLVY